MENKYPREHCLCGLYYRVKRGNKCHSICLSDMTSDEIDKVTSEMSIETMRSAIKTLANVIHDIGETAHIFSNMCGEGEKYD